jgi:hypothetical protein
MEEKISLNELQARFRTENREALTTVTIRVEVAITRNQDEQGEPVQELNALLNVLKVPDPKEETRASVRYTETQEGGRSHAQETEHSCSLV